MRRRQMGSGRLRWFALAPLLAVLALAACGLPGQSGPVLDAALVLQRTQAASIKDLSFSMKGTFAANLGSLLGSQSGGSGVSLDGSGTGKITMAPQRADVSLALGSSGGIAFEFITDAATQTVYAKIPGLSQITGGSNADQWYSLSAGSASALLDTSIFTNFENLTQAKNIGSSTLNGVSVWHLQGKQQYGGAIATATEDFYVRQDNYYPVKVVVSGSATIPTEVAGGAGVSGSPGATINITIDFTGVNSGTTITLPSGSQPLGF
ncbi:MAG: hypothetical protein IVW57_12015 [Ktedonobacterales bacterium]|nr:hypothetical protein [Ktedonobacterales bacterium]